MYRKVNGDRISIVSFLKAATSWIKKVGGKKTLRFFSNRRHECSENFNFPHKSPELGDFQPQVFYVCLLIYSKKKSQYQLTVCSMHYNDAISKKLITYISARKFSNKIKFWGSGELPPSTTMTISNVQMIN